MPRRTPCWFWNRSRAPGSPDFCRALPMKAEEETGVTEITIWQRNDKTLWKRFAVTKIKIATAFIKMQVLQSVFFIDYYFAALLQQFN